MRSSFVVVLVGLQKETVPNETVICVSLFFFLSFFFFFLIVMNSDVSYSFFNFGITKNVYSIFLL